MAQASVHTLPSDFIIDVWISNLRNFTLLENGRTMADDLLTTMTEDELMAKYVQWKLEGGRE